jgi:hypothetical protein
VQQAAPENEPYVIVAESFSPNMVTNYLLRENANEVTTLYPRAVVRTLAAPHLLLQIVPELAGREIAEFLGAAARGA